MKGIAWLITITAFLFTVFWLVWSITTERAVTGWLDDQEGVGWSVSYDEVETSGFPTVFSTRFTGLNLADPFTGWAWAADEFELIQPSYQPQSVRAIWPDEHVLATPFERLTIRSTQMEAMLHVRPAANMALRRAEVDLAALDISSHRGWSSQMGTATFEVTRADGDAPRYDIAFTAQGFTPAGEVLRLLDPARTLPEAIETLQIDTVMGFTRVWDLSALETTRPQITLIDLTELRAEWGDLSLLASGDLTVDAQGVPTGDLALRAENWPAMIALGVNAGAIPAAMRSTLETGLALIANLSGRPQDLDVTLSFAEGQAYLGPIPLGPAPLFILY